MKKAWIFSLAVVALGLGVLLQGNAGAADDETQLLQLERAWSQAEVGADPAAIASLFDEALVYVDYDGSLMNKAEYLRSVGSSGEKPDHMYDEGMKVHVYGNVGIVTGIYRETGSHKGKPYTRRARFTDTWIKRDGQWKCVASQSTLVAAVN